MPSFTATIFAASAFLSAVSGSPLMARDVCGAAPTGTTSQTPLQQPTGITTAALCQAQCTSASSCQSFMFGLVNGVDTCILYSVPASSLPAVTNMVAYDVSCSSVPTVVPTESNPTGVAVSSSGSTSSSGSDSGSSNTTPTTGTQNTGAQRLRVRDTCGAAPAGSTSANVEPIATPALPTGSETAAECKIECQANTSCKSFTFDNKVCKLFAVAASEVPAGEAATVYDVGCAL